MRSILKFFSFYDILVLLVTFFTRKLVWSLLIVLILETPLRRISGKTMPSFMELLEELRNARGISKKDMAIRAGLSPGYISLLTLGTRQTPSEDVVRALAEALELDVKERIELFE